MVPAAAARRGPGGRAAGPAAGLQPVRRLAAHPHPGGAAAARRRRPARAAHRGRAGERLAAGGRPRRRPARAASACCAGCAARSCCASPRADLLGRLDVVGRSAGRSPTSPPPPCRSVWTPRSGPTPWRPAPTSPTSRWTSPSSAWAGSAAARWASAPTPTSCSCTARGTAPTRARRPPRPTPWRTRCAGCSREPAPDPAFEVDADLRPGGRGRARWCAACRPSASTTSAGCRSGRCRRCCAPCRWPATRSWGRTSSR